MRFLESGRRLEKSEFMSSEIYNIMQKCWEYKPNERPDFTELENMLKKSHSKQSDEFFIMYL